MQKLSQEAKPTVTIVGKAFFMLPRLLALPTVVLREANPHLFVTQDVREPGELKQTGHIPHAINIPINSAPDSFHISPEEFEDRFGFPRPDKDKEVVFYCKAGVRCRGAAGIAKDAGWTKVGEYPGSWTEWFEKNGPVER